MAWLRQLHRDIAQDPAGVAAEDEDPVAHQHGLFDVVRDENHGFDRHLAFGPQIEEVRAQGFGGQDIERRERLVHQENGRMHDQCAREPDALAHATGELARIR